MYRLISHRNTNAGRIWEVANNAPNSYRVYEAVSGDIPYIRIGAHGPDGTLVTQNVISFWPQNGIYFAEELTIRDKIRVNLLNQSVELPTPIYPLEEGEEVFDLQPIMLEESFFRPIPHSEDKGLMNIRRRRIEKQLEEYLLRESHQLADQVEDVVSRVQNYALKMEYEWVRECIFL